MAQTQGPRSEQEDFTLHVPFWSHHYGRGHLLGAFDGHAGAHVARFCVARAPELFNPNMESAEASLRALVATLVDATKNAFMGSTLALACVVESKRCVVAATLGDSTVAVRGARGVRLASVPHSARVNASDLKRACEAGATFDGDYLYANGNSDGIQLTRALGDRAFNNILQRTPAVFTSVLDRHSVVVVGTDGVITPGTSPCAHDSWNAVLQSAIRLRCAETVLTERCAAGVDDNASLVMWRAHKLWLF